MFACMLQVGQLYLARSEIAAARSQWDQAIQYSQLHLKSLEGSEMAGSQGLFLAQASIGERHGIPVKPQVNVLPLPKSIVCQFPSPVCKA